MVQVRTTPSSSRVLCGFETRARKGATGNSDGNGDTHDNISVDDPRMQALHEAIEDIVPMMPIVLPIAGAVLMFLLAFIAVNMA